MTYWRNWWHIFGRFGPVVSYYLALGWAYSDFFCGLPVFALRHCLNIVISYSKFEPGINQSCCSYLSLWEVFCVSSETCYPSIRFRFFSCIVMTIQDLTIHFLFLLNKSEQDLFKHVSRLQYPQNTRFEENEKEMKKVLNLFLYMFNDCNLKLNLRSYSITDK